MCEEAVELIDTMINVLMLGKQYTKLQTTLLIYLLQLMF